MGNDQPTGEERATFTVSEAAKLLGIGRRQGYEGVRAGTIPAIRIGARILIPRRALERLLDAGDERETTPTE